MLSSSSLDDRLLATLAGLADVMALATSPWWVISGAAAALHGDTSLATSDVDVLLGRSDALRVAEVLGCPARKGQPSDQFRSDLFFPWKALPLTVEFMAGFCIREQGRWRVIRPLTRSHVRVNGIPIPVPGRDEVIAMFERFGRPKDLVRARALRALGETSLSIPHG